MKNSRPRSEYEKSQPGGSGGSFGFGRTPVSWADAPPLDEVDAPAAAAPLPPVGVEAERADLRWCLSLFPPLPLPPGASLEPTLLF